jgi:hypothetical protein
VSNQKDNLIYTDTTHLLQAAPKRKGCASQYKGATYDPKRKGNKWYAQIAKDRKKYFLGYHPTEVEAALAYNEAARKLYGKDAFMNDIKQPATASHPNQELQKLAQQMNEDQAKTNTAEKRVKINMSFKEAVKKMGQTPPLK